ncbi:MAG: hypothetical protein KJO05_08975, partial [Bacteroidia bacterium]|nr:hypothetical protein [Bacteroidia bacterium]
FRLLQGVEPQPHRLAVYFKRPTGSFSVTSPFSRTLKPSMKKEGFFVCFKESNRSRIVWQFTSKDPPGLFP